jgi:hypothetical protein
VLHQVIKTELQLSLGVVRAIHHGFHDPESPFRADG